MKYFIHTLLSFGVSTAAFAHHPTHAGHDHTHGRDCGHVGEWHVNHIDYEDNGHDHHQDGGDTHEENLAVTEEHAHDHGSECGHETRVQNNRLEFNHDGHWHHAHGAHYHESHE